MTLVKWIKSLFALETTTEYQNSLDYFLASKRPTSTAEVEYWIRYYDQKIAKGGVF